MQGLRVGGLRVWGLPEAGTRVESEDEVEPCCHPARLAVRVSG